MCSPNWCCNMIVSTWLSYTSFTVSFVWLVWFVWLLGILDFTCADGCHTDVPVITIFLLGRGSSGNSRKWELLGMAEVDGFGEDFGITWPQTLEVNEVDRMGIFPYFSGCFFSNTFYLHPDLWGNDPRYAWNRMVQPATSFALQKTRIGSGAHLVEVMLIEDFCLCKYPCWIDISRGPWKLVQRWWCLEVFGNDAPPRILEVCCPIWLGFN